MNPLVGIIQFPGSNCEYETEKAARFYGLNTRILRWNESVETLSHVDAYILPGGFSYQDRVRAGALAAKLPLFDIIQASNEKGKPILGICNGCQILAETGLLNPVSNTPNLEVALGPNQTQDSLCGFICDWVYVKPMRPKENKWTCLFEESDCLPIPINHAEGRFVLSESAQKTYASHTHFVYCDAMGHVCPESNPNGSFANLAGLSNPFGNILGMMPHPERASFIKQIPTWLISPFSDMKRHFSQVNGPWEKLFLALKASL